MYSKVDNIKIIVNYEADDVIKEILGSFKHRYQNNVELINGSEFVFDYGHSLYCKCHKINLNCGGAYIGSPDWIKNNNNNNNSNNISHQ